MPLKSRTLARFAWLARVRALAFSVGTTAYVAAVALFREEGKGPRPWLFGIVALIVAYRAARPRGPMATRIATWGLAMVLASAGTREADPWLDTAGCTGALLAACAARWALSHTVSTPGLATQKPTSPVPAIVLFVLMWGEAATASLANAAEIDFELAPFARLTAALASGLTGVVLLVSGLRAMRHRKLEMGVTARIVAAMGLLATITILATTAALLRLEDPDRIGRFAVALGSILIGWITLHGDGVRIAEIARRALVLSFAGGTLALFGAGLVEGNMKHRALAVVFAAVATLLVGAASKLMADGLRPMRGAWIDACHKARERLLHEEPEEAIRLLMLEMRAPLGGISQTPELWTFAPTRVTKIDLAGYIHEEDGPMPLDIVRTAAEEPEATLRVEVLDALQVRRPDLRALAAWMEARNALTATVVTRGGEPEGLLVLPCGPRWEFLTLEEARALKRLADALASVCHARGAQRRQLARELELQQRAEKAEDEVEKLRHSVAVNSGRHALAAQRLARPATVGVYAAASRLALEAIERRAEVNAPICLLTPSGVDPVPYVARAHLHGPRSKDPFVLVDATQAREHDLARWNDPEASPLALADRGTLVLLDGPSLPLDIQRIVARALAEKRPPWERAEPLDIALVMTTVIEPGTLVDTGRLDPALGTRLGDSLHDPVRLPRLRDRAEDLRAIVTDRLAREGMRVRGVPVGIEMAAFARLVDHSFPGEDAELAALAQRLVAACPGDVVRAADVDAVIAPPPVERAEETRESLLPPDGGAPQSAEAAPKKRRKKGAASA